MIDKVYTIIEASKILAEYQGYKYIPFNDLQGFEKPGWWKVALNIPTNYDDLVTFHPKSSWKRVEGNPKIKAKYLCRHHSGLRYYNSYDWLFSVIEQLEKEDLSQYFYQWPDEGIMRSNFASISVDRFRGWGVNINLELDPPIEIPDEWDKYKDLTDREQLFWTLVDAVKYVTELKNGESSGISS